ncbi:hypothetical protein V8E55_002019 [Tylopilus felleus]
MKASTANHLRILYISVLTITMTCLTSQSSFSNHLSISFVPHPLRRSPFHIICFSLSLASAIVNRTAHPTSSLLRIRFAPFVLVLTFPSIVQVMTSAGISTIYYFTTEIRIHYLFHFLTSYDILSCCGRFFFLCPLLFPRSMSVGPSLRYCERCPYVSGYSEYGTLDVYYR